MCMMLNSVLDKQYESFDHLIALQIATFHLSP